MKRSVFAGKCDKSDVVLYLAAILRTLGHGVAVVDMSADKKYKYHTSSIDMNEVVDEHDGLTILYGPNGLNKAESENMKFDFAIFDIGSVKEWNDVLNVGRDVDAAFVCTTYRKHNVAINAEFAELISKSTQNFATVLFHTNSSVDADYVVANLYKDVDAGAKPLYVIYDDEYRHRAQIENEYSAKIYFKFVPKEMKAAMSEMLEKHFGQDPKSVKRAMKKLMKKERRG